MRPSAWVTLLVFVIVAAGVRTHSARAEGRQRKLTASPPATNSSWVVEGWGSSSEEAVNVALKKAEEKVVTHLHDRSPHIPWSLPPDYVTSFVRERLWKDIDLPEQGDNPPLLRRTQHNGHSILEDQRFFDEPVGLMRCVQLKIELGPDDYTKIKQKQREVTSEARQHLLARGLAGVVALLVAVVGYFRLEEATKGYYTAWLRLAAISLVAAVVAGLLLAA